jgi:hypothetical protein
MRKGYDNFTMVDSQLATRRVKGTDYFYMNPPVNFNTMPGASEPVIDPNASGSAGIDANAAVGLANTAGQLLLLAQNRRAAADAAKSDLEKNIEAACGKQPVGCALDIFNLRPDCKAYKQCRADYVANVQALERAAVEAEAAAAAANRSLAGGQGERLSTGAIVGIVAGSVLVLGGIAYLLLKNKK